MHMQGVPGAAAFVQIIDVLRDDRHAVSELRLQRSQRAMRGVRRRLDHAAPAGVVEGVHLRGIARKPSGVATSDKSYCDQTPPLSRNVPRPDSADSPAPVSITTSDMAAFPGSRFNSRHQ